MADTELETFASEVVACRACEIAGYLEHANPIRPSLIDAPRVMLIGQAPGALTDRKGYHFAGPAGRFLEIWLERAGFPAGYFRERVYLTSLTRCFPGKSKSGNGDRPPSRAEMALCRRFLDREMALIQPRVVLLVGKMAIDAFVGKRLLVDSVGQVFETSGQWSVASAQSAEPQVRYFLPLPHASGVSRWLNVPANQALLDRALAELSRLRVELGLTTDH
jgi:uracil-DNA glycosylase